MNQELISNFRNQLQTGPVFGPFMKTGDPAFVEAAGYSGCDFAVLDMEHGPEELGQMQNLIRAAQVSGMLPVVRVRELSEANISQALDIGAAGVQIPQITCAEEARRAVRAARFYPEGERGMCRFVRAAHYSLLERNTYFRQANKALVIIQLEGQEAICRLNEILEVEGIDVLFIGPYDLSQSLGLPGQTTHPKVAAQMWEIVNKAKDKGIITGTFTDSEDALRAWMQAGVRYLSYSVDVGIFSDAMKGLQRNFVRLAKEMKEIKGRSPVGVEA